jgi:type II secretory pathway component PulJ
MRWQVLNAKFLRMCSIRSSNAQQGFTLMEVMASTAGTAIVIAAATAFP